MSEAGTAIIHVDELPAKKVVELTVRQFSRIPGRSKIFGKFPLDLNNQGF
jgi:hypothetical protein